MNSVRLLRNETFVPCVIAYISRDSIPIAASQHSKLSTNFPVYSSISDILRRSDMQGNFKISFFSPILVV